MKDPVLSVVIPNYNHAHYLPTALRSVLQQSFAPQEVVVIDDGSTDRSLEVIADFARQHPAVRCHRNAHNLGIVANMNLGLELARGQLLYFLGADDEALPGFFEPAVNLLSQYPAAPVACGVVEWHEEPTGYRFYTGGGTARNPCYLDPTCLVRLEKRGRLALSMTSSILRREAFLKAGGFHPELRWFTDWFALYTAAFRQGICYLPHPGGRFNVRARGFSVRGQSTPEHLQVLRGLLDRLRNASDQAAAERIRRSGALFQFGWPLLRLTLRHREYRSFLTPAFTRKCLWQIVRLEAKKFLPAPLARWYYRTFRWVDGVPRS